MSYRAHRIKKIATAIFFLALLAFYLVSMLL